MDAFFTYFLGDTKVRHVLIRALIRFEIVKNESHIFALFRDERLNIAFMIKVYHFSSIEIGNHLYRILDF